VVKDIFLNGTQLYSNSKNHPSIKHQKTGGNLELDIWVPQHEVSLEYQDPHHYITTFYNYEPLAYTQGKDNIHNSWFSALL